MNKYLGFEIKSYRASGGESVVIVGRRKLFRYVQHFRPFNYKTFFFPSLSLTHSCSRQNLKLNFACRAFKCESKFCFEQFYREENVRKVFLQKMSIIEMKTNATRKRQRGEVKIFQTFGAITKLQESFCDFSR